MRCEPIEYWYAVVYEDKVTGVQEIFGCNSKRPSPASLRRKLSGYHTIGLIKFREKKNVLRAN